MNKGCHFRMTAFSGNKYNVIIDGKVRKMIKRKVELLAPAGDFSCFLAAMNAGADAVYMGGSRFGARAYANNFTEDEIIEALRIAHLLGRKVYLTVNTLVKEKEFPELVPYLRPLYEAGLDGVIVQDIGALQEIGLHFPGLELHASTQMTITGAYSAKLLKNMGVCRVVPARELSLQEIATIKEETGLEIETFIHGAMCYGYSGQCLFSSILGGRSGNRGRCAGPCRLPYTDEKKRTVYPLSLKDMYTLSMIPELIEAGIDSFKIEGRMKSPEYVAGVTAMYRKYIDNYMKNPDKPFRVEAKDEAILRKLYIRSDICHGYYKQHNSADMVTIKEPGYSGCDEDVLVSIRQNYIQQKKTLPIRGEVEIIVGKPAKLFLQYQDKQVCVQGDEVTAAQNRPLEEMELKNRISKLGDTYFHFEELKVVTDGCSFMPVKVLNELRRQACQELENAIIASNSCTNRMGSDDEVKQNDLFVEEQLQTHIQKQKPFKTKTSGLGVLVSTMEQLEIVLNEIEIDYVYVSADIFLRAENRKHLYSKLQQCDDRRWYLALPHILRKRSYQYLQTYKELLCEKVFHGVLIRNLETLQWLIEIGYQGEYIADYQVYTWNRKAENIGQQLFTRTTLPVELNKKELAQLSQEDNKECLVYGRLPLMYSANCVQKTMEHCVKAEYDGIHLYQLTDRYRNVFPIEQNCLHCYNILYNTVPMSLHNQMDYLQKCSYGVYRIDFTLEHAKETQKIIRFYQDVMHGKNDTEFPYTDFTNGHFKRGVE